MVRWEKDISLASSLDASEIKIEAKSQNIAKCSLEIKDSYLNSNGVVMGDIIFSMADYTFALANNLDKQSPGSTNSQIDFISTTNAKFIYSDLKCIKKMEKVSIYQVCITDSDKKLVATATMSGFAKNK